MDQERQTNSAPKVVILKTLTILSLVKESDKELTL